MTIFFSALRRPERPYGSAGSRSSGETICRSVYFFDCLPESKPRSRTRRTENSRLCAWKAVHYARDTSPTSCEGGCKRGQQRAFDFFDFFDFSGGKARRFSKRFVEKTRVILIVTGRKSWTLPGSQGCAPRALAGSGSLARWNHLSRCPGRFQNSGKGFWNTSKPNETSTF